MEKIFKEIGFEREDQDEEWGGPDHDDAHEVDEFFMFIRWQGAKFEQDMDSLGCLPDPKMARERYIKIAALAVAAIESIDRKSND